MTLNKAKLIAELICFCMIGLTLGLTAVFMLFAGF
jgi:hypothetical protein